VLDFVRFGHVLDGRTDEVFVLALAASFAAVALLGRRERQPRAWRLPLLAAITVIAYFCAPFDVGYMSWIGHRAIPFAVLLILASPLLAPGRATSALCALAVALQLGYGAKLAAAYRAFDREAELPALDQVLSAAERGKNLVGQIWRQESDVVQFRPYMHFAMYYEVRRGGRAVFNFAETPWTPVRFRRGTEPKAMPRSWEWHPEWLDPAASDAHYLLLRGPAAGPESGFRLRARAGRWRLYERMRD
jgi:hypothetical protein